MKKLASVFVATLFYSIGFSQLPVVNAVGGEDEIDYQPIVDEYMEEYPCWTMPGQSVSAEYEEACYEYQQSRIHVTYNIYVTMIAIETCQ